MLLLGGLRVSENGVSSAVRLSLLVFATYPLCDESG